MIGCRGEERGRARRWIQGGTFSRATRWSPPLVRDGEREQCCGGEERGGAAARRRGGVLVLVAAAECCDCIVQ